MLLVPHGHLGPASVPVFERVRERLLDDPVRRDVDPGRDRARFPGYPYLHLQPGEGEPVDQRAQPGKGRLRRQPGGGRGLVRFVRAVLGGGEQAQQVPQFGHRVPPGRLHGAHRRRGLLGQGGEHLAGGSGLHHHQAHVVADDVVELRRDPGPFGVDGAAGRALALPLQQPAALLQRHAVAAPGAQQHRAERARHGRRHAGRDHGDDQPHPELPRPVSLDAIVPDGRRTSPG